MATSARRDSYGRRLVGAMVLALAVGIVLSLLGPEGNPDGEWFEHTGMEGEIQILDAIEIVQDDDPVVAREARRMEGATQGVSSPLTEKVVNERNPNPVARENPEGADVPDPMVERRVQPDVMAALQEDAYVEMNRAAQQSDQFVLLESVHPRYPAGVPDAVRQREIVVRVNMYVDETGHVTHCYVDRNDGGPRFEDAVVTAVKQWVYRPLVVDGEVSGFWDTIYFVFRVGPGPDTVETLDRLRSG